MATTVEVRVPDIGDFKQVPVLQLLVQPGSRVAEGAPVITLESDKTTIDVPSSASGTVLSLLVSVGQPVSAGTPILILEADAAPARAAADEPSSESANAGSKQDINAVLVGERETADEVGQPAFVSGRSASIPARPVPVVDAASRRAYAGPAVRNLARAIGFDLSQMQGSGPNGRILKKDVLSAVMARLPSTREHGAEPGLQHSQATGWPTVDFERFGSIERQPLSRIQQRSGTNLARNWATIPHVTNFEEADVTDLDAFRVQLNEEHRSAGVKLTMLAFLVRASAAALRKFPDFNVSLDGEARVRKQYCHVGFAADTPVGLVVPVIRDADRKGLVEIACEAAELAKRARDGQLRLADMEGGCFTVSSLGAIGGVGFTPIINAPEIAILGAAKARLLPRWNGQQFVPRLILPLALSWDHRAVDGAAAARFLSYLGLLLTDLRRWMV